MNEAPRAVAVVTAAGSDERFGGEKLLAIVDGVPLLERVISTLVDGGVGEVIVVVGGDARHGLERDVKALSGPRVRTVENPDPARGMFSSIQEGARSAEGDVMLVHPGDMPFVQPATVRQLLDVWALKRGIVSPRYAGKNGHPVALALALRDELLATPPSANLHEVIKRHEDERVDVEVDDPGVVRDVDRREDLPR